MPQNDSGAAPEKGGATVTKSPTGDPSTSFYADAEAVHLAERATQHGSPDPADWPAYHRPGTPEWSCMVAAHADRLQWEAAVARSLPGRPPMQPADRLPTELATYIDTDASTGRTVMLDAAGNGYDLDRRVELRIPGLVADAEDRHNAGRHREGMEHGCPSCWVDEERRSNPDGTRGLTATVLLAGGGQAIVDGRWRSHLLTGRRVAEDREVTAPVLTRPDDAPVYVSLGDLEDLGATPELVEGIFPATETLLLVARGGVGKTTLTVELAYCVLTLQDFHGRPIALDDPTGRVLMVATEGARHLPAQFAAIAAHHGRQLSTAERANLTIRTEAVDLFDGGPALEELIERCRVERPDLVIIDTLQRCAGRADQNNAADVSRITASLDRIKRASGGSVLVVAHAGKSGEDARGSSALQDDARAVWTLKPDGDRIAWGFPKLFHREDGFTETLHPRQVAGSLVLADQPDPLRAIRWTSGSPENKVIAALRGLAPLGPQSQAAIVRQAEDVPQSVVSRALARLVSEGAVHRVGPSGRGATYALTDPASSTPLDGEVDEA